MFTQKLNLVTSQIENEYQDKRPTVNLCVCSAVKVWCYQFDIPQNITDYILNGYRLYEIKDLTTYIYQELQPKQEEEKNWLGSVVQVYKNSKLFNLVASILNRINVRSDNMKFLVIIAFGITAVGYWLYKVNQQGQQQQTRREEPKQYTPSPPPSPPPAPKIINQFLVLVISASQVDFLKLIQAKRQIDLSDGERLYEVTKYLWLGSETEFSQKTAHIINQYSIPKGQESEYDIYLVYIKLKQIDSRFKPNVSQLDRYDAFRELRDLIVNFEISPRLQIEAYGNIEVYSR
ncbi:hypothetical protein [Nostoc sp. ATCC 53789]|uniref:hypothetical protein n=1 Tax=Nostoc sp. ATCC 53789 TaxID=76335 RepID=UPI000DEC3E53|nr:hypothetical protein [Nostoc sp. ATCC 53789]QHG16599.1 hypothetical protein GJB62_11865 [Nostoc sp. ATCC 53789]RCJ35474.1 hypothetical protein A6V25_09715 [Nostoc sp. ATCC 53789]